MADNQTTHLPFEFDYPSQASLVDEARDAEGQLHPHWSYILNSFQALGTQAIKDRQTKAQRILRDDGATYNIYNKGNSRNQTWGLDLVPFVISSEEWAQVEAGLLERAELYNLLLKDLYGPRQLIRTGVIPPEALYGHPDFLRACQGISLPGEYQLILHSADLMRDANGEMCLLNDRTQSPSGAGYALENRVVMSRVLPSLFRDSHVHRLARFFQLIRQKLVSLTQQSQPRIVVLTPGVHNEAYFEHAYIANYLGFHLVQSGDLVVRNGFVWMKSLEGLSRVDVILRRVDDAYCDPVELRGDSQLGVPNLLEVVRSGNVVIANPLGSGILENPIFLKYLPEISKTLLGREPRLKSVTTYWCANAEDLNYVEANLSKLVIKPVHRHGPQRGVSAALLSSDQRQELLQKIKANPENFVAQPVLPASHLPTLDKSGLAPRPAILRSFAVATDNSYSIMPGGLTRVGMEQAEFFISVQAGSQSKDTWVIASEPERDFSTGYNRDENIIGQREADLISLPSRVVENLFWMGRYAERAEASLRLLRTVFMMLNGEDTISEDCKLIILQSVSEVSGTLPGFAEADAEVIANPEQTLIGLVNDANTMGTVRSNLVAMLNCADQSKELLSSDMLRVINDIQDGLDEMDRTLTEGNIAAPEETLDPLVTGLMALSGLIQESMVRGMGWRFMEIGRRLERSMQTTTLIKSLLITEVSGPEQNTLIHALLLSLEVLISYRRLHRARTGVQTSLDLVMLDTSNPRSLLFQIGELKNHLDALPKSIDSRHELAEQERALLEAESLLKLSRLAELSKREDGERILLKKQLNKFNKLLGVIGATICDKYFNHRESSRQLIRGIGSK